MLFLFLVAIGLLIAAYYLNQKQQHAPFIEEIKSDRHIEEEEVKEEARKDNNPNKCPNNHSLNLSDDSTGYPGGYYMCYECKKVLPCSELRWNCSQCSYDICLKCKPKEIVGEQEAKEEPEEKPVELEIEQIIESKQLDDVGEHRVVKPDENVSWNDTHFIFAIDCSSSNLFLIFVGTMKGERWDTIMEAYKKALSQLRKMHNISISCFTYDENVNPFIQEDSPDKAYKSISKIPNSEGEGKDHEKAFEHIVEILSNTSHPSYLNCILFVSAGSGTYPDDSMARLQEMKKQGLKMLFYGIACITEDEECLMNIVQAVDGELFKFSNPDSGKEIYSALLGV